ncbi:CMGC/RCK/MAK protein kinase [Puccinia triticina 1-1 BBBD Race 1]|uniref:CMGC/RCK/MAK protein kinase n=1 Tax=Puccinia triticina (isolate 1-1 / race 1 (BBBD)) TaxID=630390 RepID=A0A0C4EYT6_PUCT1|nr:CMGC/RCK/MAK protein kinase [Puccinia triticina 1-1 BBBD Race 1]WAR54127.1 hypothetical protein PtB15_3B639 [Puccinia triticina]
MSNRPAVPVTTLSLSSSSSSTHNPLPDVGTRDYTILKEVGDGSFGTVWLADWHSPLTLPPGTQPPGPSSRPEYKGKQLVAVKKMKKTFDGGWDECMKLKELKSLRTIPMHPFTIPLYDAFLHPTTRELYFVFECMEGNLYQLTKSRKGRPLAGGLIACIFEQTLLGLHHVHACGFFHRDMKPENLLITTTGLTDYPHGSPYALPTAPPERDVAVILKIADFGLARETNSRPPYTEYVSTRWYRAPEVLLRARDYSNPVDMWALGAILVETVTLKPLFPGNGEMDQVHRICEIMGDPQHPYGLDDKGRLRGGGQWLGGVALAKAVGFSFPDKVPIDFVQLFDTSNIPIQLIDCLHELLRYEPRARLTTAQCLAHSYFTDVAPRLIPPSLSGIGMLNSSLARGLPSPRPNTVYPASPEHLGAHQQQHYMPVDLPSISPQIVPVSHNQAGFPNARPTHVLTPSNSSHAVDSIMTDGEPSGDHHQPNGQAYPPRAYVTPPEFQRRGSQPYENYPQPPQGYEYSAPMIAQDPSFLSLSTGLPSPSDPSRASTDTRHTNTSNQLKVRSRTLASVFSGSQSLKRTPSERVFTDGCTTNPSPTLSLDPKKAKKEAEKAAKEEAKLEAQAKREAARRSAQERSRAVLQKQRLAQGSDILIHVNPEFAAPVGAPRKAVDKGKGRATLHPPMPQIVEDCSRTRNGQPPLPSPASTGAPSFHTQSDRSVYYGDDRQTRPEYPTEERRYSFNSSNTMDSDPGPRSQHINLVRSPSHGSGYSRLSVASSPNLASLYRASTPASTTSSLDHQLIANMAGLCADEQSNANNGKALHKWPKPPPNEKRASDESSALSQSRSRSPSDPRFSPYAVPPMRTSLPSIANFDFPSGPPPQPPLPSPGHPQAPERQHPERHLSISSGSPSILSHNSFPIGPRSPYSTTSPSNYHQPQQSSTSPPGAHTTGSPNLVFDLTGSTLASSEIHYHQHHQPPQQPQHHQHLQSQQQQQNSQQHAHHTNLNSESISSVLVSVHNGSSSPSLSDSTHHSSHPNHQQQSGQSRFGKSVSSTDEELVVPTNGKPLHHLHRHSTCCPLPPDQLNLALTHHNPLQQQHHNLQHQQHHLLHHHQTLNQNHLQNLQHQQQHQQQQLVDFSYIHNDSLHDLDDDQHMTS